MVKWPWNRDKGDEHSGGDDADAHADAVVVCSFQDGTLVVYEDHVTIERARRSQFDDVTIPLDEITGVDYDEGLTIGYFQLERSGITPDKSGLMSDPVNERTVHFGRGERDCARRARDAVLERASG